MYIKPTRSTVMNDRLSDAGWRINTQPVWTTAARDGALSRSTDPVERAGVVDAEDHQVILPCAKEPRCHDDRRTPLPQSSIWTPEPGDATVQRGGDPAETRSRWKCDRDPRRNDRAVNIDRVVPSASVR